MRRTILGVGVLAAGLLSAPAPALAATTCGGHTITIFGTPASETLVGTQFTDVFWADAGNDTVVGLGEGDVACLGPGNDTFIGGEGDDTAIADAVPDGADTLVMGDGRDTVDYSARTTSVTITLDSQVDDGAPGEGDFVNPDVEFVYGGSAGDTLVGNKAPFLGEDLRGNGGDDKISTGGGGSDQLVGGPGNDTLDATGNNLAVGLYGEEGDDTLIGGNGDDPLAGGPGVDKITGNDGNDSLFGGDVSSAVADKDTLDGGNGNDILRGDAGDDTLIGGSGTDLLDGNAGNDIITGGPGNDLARGFDGDDQFISDAVSDGSDEFFGMGGFDSMSYSLRTSTVQVSLDDVKDDGTLGEHDNVASDVERVTGGSGDDFLLGNAVVANRLVGGIGSDTINGIDGIAGNDIVDGSQGPGTDSCRADTGDTILNCP